MWTLDRCHLLSSLEHGGVYHQIYRSGRKHPKVSNSDLFWLLPLFPQKRFWMCLATFVIQTHLISKGPPCTLIYFAHYFRSCSISSSCPCALQQTLLPASSLFSTISIFKEKIHTSKYDYNKRIREVLCTKDNTWDCRQNLFKSVGFLF